MLSTCTQVQYDFGLRGIIHLLRVLSPMKRAEPVESEQTLVVRALRDVNLAQLVDRDEPIFLSFVSDLFQGIIPEKTSHPKLEETLAKELDAGCLMNHSPWTFKLMQVTSTLLCCVYCFYWSLFYQHVLVRSTVAR